jgi:hypothetical protein
MSNPHLILLQQQSLTLIQISESGVNRLASAACRPSVLAVETESGTASNQLDVTLFVDEIFSA